jgi:uncharacterized protein YndB with AHSA1/START domain
MTTDETDIAPALIITREFTAAPERVFAAFTVAREIAAWYGPETVTTTVDTFEARAGAPFRLVMLSDEGNEFPVSGVIEEIDPPRRLVMSWAWEKGDYAGRETRLSLDFAPIADGGTALTLTHELLANDEARALHDQGWTSAMAALGAYLGKTAN